MRRLFATIFIFALMVTGLMASGVNATTSKGLYIPTEKELIVELLKLDDRQKEVLYKVFNRGSGDNLAWSAAAIAWQESKFGNIQMELKIFIDTNTSKPYKSFGCGIFQNELDVILNKYQKPKTAYNRSYACTQLVSSPEVAYKEFRDNIQFWMSLHGDNWYKVWASYNGGYYPSKVSQDYAHIINLRIQALRKVYGGTLVASLRNSGSAAYVVRLTKEENMRW